MAGGMPHLLVRYLDRNMTFEAWDKSYLIDLIYIFKIRQLSRLQLLADSSVFI